MPPVWQADYLLADRKSTTPEGLLKVLLYLLVLFLIPYTTKSIFLIKKLIIAGIIPFLFSGFAFVHTHPIETGADNTLEYFNTHIPVLINAAKT